MGDYDLQVVEAAATSRRSTPASRSRSTNISCRRCARRVTGPKDAAVRPTALPLDLFVGYLSGGGASNLPVELRVGYSRTSADARRL